MTSEERNLILEALSRSIGGVKFICSLCGGTRWNVLDGVVMLPLQPEMKAVGLVIGGPALTLLPLMCNHCGCTVFVNLAKLGILKKLEDIEALQKGDELINEALS